MKVFLLLATLAVEVWSSFGCPSVCRCDDRRKIVFCNERFLTRIPYGIPSDTKVLFLQGNLLTNSPTLESILSGLPKLTKLELHNNRLTSFPDRLPASLDYLSLKANSIKFIGKDVLSSLSNLEMLYLDSNNLTNTGLALGTFSDAISLKELTLSRNQLTALPENLPASLETLRIDRNRISDIPYSALQSLRNLVRLDISYNEIERSWIGFNHLRKLKSLNLERNLLLNVPTHLPENITELRLSSNGITYIYAKSAGNHGTFRNLEKLSKLDLSSNKLVSVEKGSFDHLLPSVSIELHDNPWRCDCNLVYLKRWLTSATSILLSSKSDIKCNAPASFQGVTVDAIDVEALTCRDSHFSINATSTDSTKIVVACDVRGNEEPPYVSYLVMYGAMLCEDCSLQGVSSASSFSQASLWMENYTIAPLGVPDAPIEIKDLKPDTRYVVCVLSSSQHPDQIGINQCRDVMTSSAVSPTEPQKPPDVSLPIWVIAVIALSALVSLSLGFAVTIYCYKKHKNHSRTSGYQGPRASSERRNPFVDARQEFIIGPTSQQDVKRHSDSLCSDSREESIATTHTGTSASWGSGREYRSEEHHYETPFALAPVVDEYDRLRRNDRPALFV